MSPSEGRELFEDDAGGVARSRLLRGMLLLALVLVVIGVVAEAAPGVGQAVRITAAVLTAATMLAAVRTAGLLGRDERRLRREAETYVDLARTLLVACDGDSRVAMANPEACRILGRSEAELLGRRFQDFLADAAIRERSLKSFRQLLAGEIAPADYRSQRTLVQPDGTLREVAFWVAVRLDDDGVPNGLLISGEDITEQIADQRRRERDVADLQRMRGLAQTIASTRDARPAIVEELAALADADFATLAEPVDGAGDEWTMTHSTDDGQVGTTSLPGEPSAVRATAASGAPRWIGSASGDAVISARRLSASRDTCLLLHPVTTPDGVVAVLIVGWRTCVSEPDGHRRQLIGLIAEEAALALQRLADQRELERAALIDVLTGVANRRAFDTELARAITQARRDGRPLTLMTIDLNGFKRVNDLEGHQVGDRLLADCAQAWSAVLRAGDTLARVGGDEFAVILPGCAFDTAHGLAERLRAVTPHAPGTATGLATWSGQDADGLAAAADRALYADKAAGREPARLAAHADGA